MSTVIPIQASLSQGASSDMSKFLRELYQATLRSSGHAQAAAMDAMRALWRWICAMIDRIGKAFGLRVAKERQSDEQLAGEEATNLSLESDGSPGMSGVDVETARESVLAEAARLVKFLSENPVDPALLTNAEFSEDYVSFQAQQLGKYHAVFKSRVEELESEILAKCGAIAGPLGTTPQVIRAQVVAGSEAGLYDKDGTLKALIDESTEIKLAMGRVQLAAFSLISVCGRTSSAPGLKQRAVDLFAMHIPGIPLDREPPPPPAVADASGETLAVGREVDAAVAVKTEAVADAAEDSGPPKSFAARDGIAAKSILEFGAFEQRGPKPGFEVPLRVVGGVSTLPATEEEVEKAMSSSFVSSTSMNLQKLADLRREKNKTDWGDAPAHRS